MTFYVLLGIDVFIAAQLAVLDRQNERRRDYPDQDNLHGIIVFCLLLIVWPIAFADIISTSRKDRKELTK